MANTSIQSGSGKPEMNPALLFQATPAPKESADGGFEAALNRAREPERPETPRQPSQSQQAQGSGEPARERPANEPARENSAERPAESAPKNADQAAKEPAENTDGAQAPQARPGKPDEAAEVSTAGLPAEIAAMIAALTAGGRVVQPDGKPMQSGAGIGADAGGSKKGNTQAGNTLSLALLGKDDGGDNGRSLTLATRETAVQQAVTLATQSGPARSFADQVMAGMRGEMVPGQQGAGVPFAARGDAGQTVAQLAQLPVSTPAGQRAWASEVGNQIAWMVGRNESKAELVLTPASLGKLGVSIQVNGDQTTAHFVAATQAAREALEQAMPRLREVLQQAGINLGQTDVSTSGDQRTHDGGPDGGSRHGGSGAQGKGEAAGVTAGPAMPTVSSWVSSGNGVIDTFA